MDQPQWDNTHISEPYPIDYNPNGKSIQNCMDPWNLESSQNVHDSYSQASFHDRMELKITEMQEDTKKLQVFVNSVCLFDRNRCSKL